MQRHLQVRNSGKDQTTPLLQGLYQVFPLWHLVYTYAPKCIYNPPLDGHEDYSQILLLESHE